MTDDEIEAVLAEFREWLREERSEVSDRRSEVRGQRSEIDVTALVGEFTALRHEVKLLTKATRAQNEQVAAVADQLTQPSSLAGSADEIRPFLTDLLDFLDGTTRAGMVASKLYLDYRGNGAAWWKRLFHPTAARVIAVRDRLNALATGLTVSHNRMRAQLERLGLQVIETDREPFDPETMEALDVIADSGRPSGTVVEELRAGYLWRGKVFRYAQVRVAK